MGHAAAAALEGWSINVGLGPQTALEWQQRAAALLYIKALHMCAN